MSINTSIPGSDIVLANAATSAEIEYFLGGLPALDTEVGAEFVELKSLEGVPHFSPDESDPLKEIVG